ncbi:integrase core domain protein [Daphnia sinensis]|uniref:Integrase core domain protein n=1 Tax=Daphnia sinensis TaxID=1820382 RepID=A0AAD5L7M2_9CRUS|nr:integrase core domain protein [Daphnia sinensis]
MFMSVKKYVSSCMYCQLHKHAVAQTVGRIQPIPPPAHAFEMLGIDHLGPLQTMDSGNKHVIVAIDYLTKWVEVAAVPDTSTNHVIPFIQDNIIHRHSHPKRLNIRRLCEGLCERLNRTATLAIAAYLNTAHTDWDTKLQGAALAVNTARQSKTEVTPFEMVYGRRPVMAQENKFPWPPERPEPYAVFAKRVADLREAARLKIIEKQRKVKEFVDRRRRVTQDLRVSELVLVKRNLNKKGKTKKFLPKFVVRIKS